MNPAGITPKILEAVSRGRVLKIPQKILQETPPRMLLVKPLYRFLPRCPQGFLQELLQRLLQKFFYGFLVTGKSLQKLPPGFFPVNFFRNKMPNPSKFALRKSNAGLSGGIPTTILYVFFEDPT